MVTTSSGKIRWGVVGCGQIGVDKSLPGLLAARGAELVAVSDPLAPRREMAQGLARAHGAEPRAYGGYHELLRDADVQAVYVALPTGQHAAAVADAAAAGKAILCEKPLGRTADEVRRMILAARRHGVPLMTAYMSRFSDVFRRACDLLRAGAIGKVTYVAAHFAYPCFRAYPPSAAGGWRYTDPAGGGPLLDIGVYLAFGIREMTGDRVARVRPFNTDTHRPDGSRVKDTTVATFVTDRGTPGTFVASFSHSGVHLNFYGTDGHLLVENCFSQRPGGRLTCVSGRETVVTDTTDDPSLPHFDNYRREFEHFSAALLAGTPHSPSDADVLADALLLDALGADAAAVDVPTPERFLDAR